jgi:cytidyltransferase-like protein
MTSRIDWSAIRYGVVLGRFQPLHLGHMEYLEAARKNVDQLVVGITNPDTSTLVYDAADPRRSRSENNPFSYFDRYQMIAASLAEFGWGYDDFVIVPAAINIPGEMKPYLPPQGAATVYVTVYDAWGDRKAELIRELGYPVSVLWRREPNDRLTSGTDIRRAMRLGEPWRKLVPDAVARYLDETGWTAVLADQSADPSESATSETVEPGATSEKSRRVGPD